MFVLLVDKKKLENVQNQIEHKGTVISIENKIVDVVIASQSACAACSVKTACGMSEMKEKIVSVAVDYPEYYVVGDEVDVMITQGMGMKAVTIAYIIPFLILLGVLLILLELGVSEIVAGLGALGATVAYYFLLYLNRGRIEKEIIFKIKKQ